MATHSTDTSEPMRIPVFLIPDPLCPKASVDAARLAETNPSTVTEVIELAVTSASCLRHALEGTVPDAKSAAQSLAGQIWRRGTDADDKVEFEFTPALLKSVRRERDELEALVHRVIVEASNKRGELDVFDLAARLEARLLPDHVTALWKAHMLELAEMGESIRDRLTKVSEKHDAPPVVVMHGTASALLTGMSGVPEDWNWVGLAPMVTLESVQSKLARMKQSLVAGLASDGTMLDVGVLNHLNRRALDCDSPVLGYAQPWDEVADAYHGSSEHKQALLVPVPTDAAPFPLDAVHLNDMLSEESEFIEALGELVDQLRRGEPWDGEGISHAHDLPPVAAAHAVAETSTGPQPMGAPPAPDSSPFPMNESLVTAIERGVTGANAPTVFTTSSSLTFASTASQPPTAPKRIRRRRKSVWEAWARQSDDETRIARPSSIHRPAKPPHTSWRAAATKVDISRRLNDYPSGYSMKAEKARGFILPRFARICLIEDPDQERMLFLNLDASGGFRWLAESLGARLAQTIGIDVGRIFPSATHAHTAEGDLFGDLFYDTLGDDPFERRPGFDTNAGNRIADELAAAAKSLEARLQDVEPRFSHRVAPQGLIWQRALPGFIAQKRQTKNSSQSDVIQDIADFRDQIGHSSYGPPAQETDTMVGHARTAVDPTIPVLSFWAGDRCVFAHATLNGTATMVAPHARIFSSDVYGAAMAEAERRLLEDLELAPEKQGPVVSLAAGAHGDSNITHPNMSVADLLRCRGERYLDDTGTRYDVDIEQRRKVALRLVRQCGDIVANVIVSAATDEAGSALASDARLAVRFAEAFAAGAWVQTQEFAVPCNEPKPKKKNHYLPTRWSFGSKILDASEFNAQPQLNLPKWSDAPKRRKINWKNAKSPRRNALSCPLKFLGLFIGLTGKRTYSPFIQFRAFSFGDIVLLGVPSEPSVRLAERFREVVTADETDRNRIVVNGNVGGFTGYSDTIGAYMVHEYEGASSYWGREFGEHHVQTLARLCSTSNFVEKHGSAPKPHEWISGGLLSGKNAVGGHAYFTMKGEPRPPDATLDVTPRTGSMSLEAISATEADHPLNLSSLVGLETDWETVRGSWEPKDSMDDLGRLRLSENGPLVRFWVHHSGTISPLQHRGSQICSTNFPVLVFWGGESQRWFVVAELPPHAGTLGFDVVRASDAALPYQAGSAVWM